MSVVLGFIGIVVAVVVLFKLAVVAAPVFIGMQIFIWAMDTGAGPIGAILAGGAAGITTLVLAQVLFANIRQPSGRMTLALGFGIPAAIAGYHIMLGVASLGVPSEAWRTVFASIGGLAAGVLAVLQLFALGEAPMPDAGEKGCVPPVSGR